ncbi:pyroglutamyl-peptidase I [Candidatus Laterigemmans baculatus]|uniref:pyroglutamyl-peptidase I n=1 Tax=Candidatus Laterigemmans baculatus TaxID=2770505 RepID=UPI0013DA8857|nr:pyroglutamyl-peptidase I [Candidatus Laterigemmans baculatus]
MPRILLTAFEPYHEWPENSSWLTLVELTRWFDSGGKVVTRRYPVDLTEMTHRLNEDLTVGYDYVLHLGQSPGTAAIQLETIGLNATTAETPLIEGAPLAYRTTLPMGRWSQKLVAEGIPTVVSRDAGIHICNAILYLSQHLVAQRALPTQVGFVHLPLAPQQAAKRLPDRPPLASMSLPMMAAALTVILTDLLTAPGDG